MNEKERAEIAFDMLKRAYQDLLEEIQAKPDLEQIKSMYKRIEASESEMKELEIILEYQKRLSEMKENLQNYLERPKDLSSAAGANQSLRRTEVMVEPEELPLTPEEIRRMGGTEVRVESLEEELDASTVAGEATTSAPEPGVSTVAGEATTSVLEQGAPTVPEAATISAPAPKEEGKQPILKKVENPGLNEVNDMIAYTETGVLDENGQPRQTEQLDGLRDEREQLFTDFHRGGIVIGGKSKEDLAGLTEKSPEHRGVVENIVKDFLGIKEGEDVNSEKMRQYRFIINAAQDLLDMFLKDVQKNIQYQGTELDLAEKPLFEIKWSKQGEKIILEIECKYLVLGLGKGMAENVIVSDQSGQLESYPLAENPNDTPALARYNYKAELVPTEKGAKLETIDYSVEINPGLSHSRQFTYPASNVFTEMQNVINAPFSLDNMERLKKAIADVKNSPQYKYIKDLGGGTKDEKKAVLMIDRLDKILNASEKSKVPIPASIIQKAIMFQVNQMKNSTEYNSGIVSLAKKAKPTESLESKEESMNTIKLSKEDFRVGREFIERVERLKKGGKIGAAALKINDPEFETFYNELKADFSRLTTIQKGVGGDIDIQRSHWNKINENFNIASRRFSGFLTDNCFSCLADEGEKYSVIETGKNILRKNIDLIKISPYYLEYQQQKRGGKEKENPQHEMFEALDRCEKLLVKAIKTQKVPLVSMANNNKLKKFFQENSKKFEMQVQEAPYNRKSASN